MRNFMPTSELLFNTATPCEGSHPCYPLTHPLFKIV
ncbi:hypothetical protein PSAR109036_13970 [Psychrobacter arenosus]|jgi:hypothetical protein